MPDQPGLYNLSIESPSSNDVFKVFSVNPPARESQLTYLPNPEAIKLWQMERLPETLNKAPGGVPTQARLALSGILQQRIWWWMLLGGLGLLVLETVLASRIEAKT